MPVGNDAGGTNNLARERAADVVPSRKRTLRTNAPGPGAVSRPGIGAINPATGLALAWNPTKERGVGGKDLYVASQGLWVGSDTNRVGGETRRRIALMPVP